MSDRIVESVVDPAAVLDEVSGGGTATCVFAGTVREANRGREVVELSYEAHRPLGERVLRELEDEAEGRARVERCRIVHRAGTLEVGEVSVVVAVTADDHAAAVEAARRTMDELKERLPMWKEERYADGSSRHLDGSPLRPGRERSAGADDEAGDRPDACGGADGLPAEPDGASGGEERARGGAP